jgi:hypothetical protein
MPGYIMHMAEANLILKELGCNKDEKWEREFIAGNLLPDTKKKFAKVTSHFWNPNTLEDMAIAPDLERFLECYKDKLHIPVVLGYYAHLYLDERFVRVYWPEMVTFYDDNGNIQTKKCDITKAKIGISGELVSRDDFFSAEYYYGDYSKMNNYFVERYQIDLMKNYALLDECPITEVQKEDLVQVLEELRWIMNHCANKRREEIKVFSEEKLCRFLEETAREFMSEVKEYVR